MAFSKEMIQSILEEHLWNMDIHQDGKFQCEFDELVEGVTIELNAIADTEMSLARVEEDREKSTQEHHEYMGELEAERMQIVDQCKHHSKTTIGSSTTCDTCGAEVNHGG